MGHGAAYGDNRVLLDEFNLGMISKGVKGKLIRGAPTYGRPWTSFKAAVSRAAANPAKPGLLYTWSGLCLATVWSMANVETSSRNLTIYLPGIVVLGVEEWSVESRPGGADAGFARPAGRKDKRVR